MFSFVSGLSLNSKIDELETIVSDHCSKGEMEASPKKPHTPDDNHTGKRMEATENIPDIMQQVSEGQTEETIPSKGSTALSEMSTEDTQLLPATPEDRERMAGTFCFVSKERISCRKDELLEARMVAESVDGGGTPESCETSSLPASESCATDSSPLGDKSLKSPAETFSSFPSSVEINKTSVSSSPAASVDLASLPDMIRCQTLSLESSAALPTTYVSLTPKIGMGKPAITKRKFSPGRPRSRQVSVLLEVSPQKSLSSTFVVILYKSLLWLWYQLRHLFCSLSEVKTREFDIGF